jgi:phosphoglycolate phosphatase
MTRLAIFDVDGTLVDSQGDIVASMTAAFQAVGLPVPARAAILSIVGLSLDHAMVRLAPEAEAVTHDRMVAAYKAHYQELRVQAGAASSPLYPGIREAVEALAARDDTLLAIATGKSRRGLLALLENHGWSGLFASVQVADDHPSKPHPSMLFTALAETGVAAERAVMIGDTTYDMNMAGAAGLSFLGVDWGYHPPALLTGAAEVLSAAVQIPDAVLRLTGEPA